MTNFAVLLNFLLLSPLAMAQTKQALELDKHVSAIPEAGFTYKGQSQLSKEESELLLADAARKKAQADKDKDCPPDGKKPDGPSKKVVGKKEEKDDWRVVFVMKISSASFQSNKTPSLTPEALGTARSVADTNTMITLASAGKLTPQKMEEILAASGKAMKNDPKASMAYVAALGDRLTQNYGDSYRGKFVTAYEQYGRMAKGASVGQCSDIEYAMLRTYKKLTGNPKAKAYLVNFQAGKALNHTTLAIEEGGQLYVVDYGSITAVPATRAEALAQGKAAGAGLAYRVFGEDTEETDKMLAHLDTPMGMFLREVSTGTATYNPFQIANYSMANVGIAKSGGSQIRVFFGELPGGDMITGVAANLAGKSKLPAGFSLEHHLGGAIAYAHKKFMTDVKTASLQSEILYINTGLGVVAPQLDLGKFSFTARTDITLEGGVWLKQYKDNYGNKESSPSNGDANLVSRTTVTGEYKGEKVSVKATASAEVMPSITTSFPSKTDGSSPGDITSTMGILPNRVTTTLDISYKIAPKVNLNLGATYQYTGLGPIGEVRAGASGENWMLNTYLRGAFDRDRTPAFVPGAGRSVGAQFSWCTGDIVKKLPVCASVEAQKSLEDRSWQVNGGLGSRF